MAGFQSFCNLNLIFTHLKVFGQKLDKSFIGFSIHSWRVQMNLITLTFLSDSILFRRWDDFNFNLHGMDNLKTGLTDVWQLLKNGYIYTDFGIGIGSFFG